MMRRYAFIIGFCLNSIYCIASKGKAQTYILYANAAHSKDKKRGNLCFHTLQQRRSYVTAKISSKIFFTKPELFFPVCAESFSRHI